MIDWVNASLTSASMAVDAMTVNATNGLKEKNMPIWKMIVLSCLFGTFQFGMPVVGYFIGTAFKEYIEDAIPWIAFGLLTLLAIKSLVEWIKDFRKIKKEGCQVCKEAETPKKIGPGTAIVQAIATSIDALCIGFVYLYLPVEEAMLVFGLIGIVTIVFSFLTVFLAKFLASKLEKWAGLIAAIVFLAVGLKILLESLLG
jgi:putative Mn2+ efflux pump MntP